MCKSFYGHSCGIGGILMKKIYILSFIYIYFCMAIFLCKKVNGQIITTENSELNQSIYSWDSKSCDDKNEIFSDLLGQIMFDKIVASMENFYKENKLYYPGLDSYKIVSLEKQFEGYSYKFIVVYEIVTYKGAHSLPYSKDYITYEIRGVPFNVKQINYIHTPKEES
jgi:hypothetical protein